MSGNLERRGTSWVPRRRAVTRPAGALPPPGPVWFPAVMGIGAAASMVQSCWHLTDVALALLACCWALLVLLSVHFTRRCLAARQAFLDSVVPVDAVPMWGTVAMALLTTGSASATVLPARWPSLLGPAWQADLVLWLLGTFIGLVSTVAFTLRLLGRSCGRPTMVWALAVVAPMVSATTGAMLVPHVPQHWQVAMLTAAAGCFGTALFMGWAVLAGACHHAWRVEPVPLAASCTAWVPVALVGQSVAAAQAIARQGSAMVLPALRPQVHQVADAFSWAVVLLGLPVVLWAVVVLVRGIRGRMPVNPSWWSMTFPMGSMALGSQLFSQVDGLPLLGLAAQAWTAVLLVAITACAVATGGVLLRRTA